MEEVAVEASRRVILDTLKQLVVPLQEGMAHDTEVVLHDLSLLPDSIVAIAGTLTGRGVGGPATDLLLRKHAAGRLESEAGYQTKLPDGRMLRSTTVVVRDAGGAPVAALCLNSDVSVWHEIGAVASLMLGNLPTLPDTVLGGEAFFRDLDEAADQLLARAIESVGVPVDLMRKQHKVAVVEELKHRGFFAMRDAVERAAHELRVSRFTIYNYLNELEELAKRAAAAAGEA